MGKKYLIAIAVGPVQDFIAAARKTRDLWFGSYVLSEISKAVAKELHTQGAELIFPSPSQENELEPFSFKDKNYQRPLNVANKILVKLPDTNKDVRATVAAAKAAAQSRWITFADGAKNLAEAAIDQNIWTEQVEDVIEFYAAWVPYTDENYVTARTRVERLLAGRKATRDFKPSNGRLGIPKSSLDGLRESVLISAALINTDLRREVQLKENEHLDAIGLVKRLGERRSFPSITRVAIDPWVRGLNTNEKGKSFLEEAASFAKENKINRTPEEYSVFRNFPYDGGFLFKHRVKEILSNSNRTDAQKVSEHWESCLNRVYREFGEPSPYFAVLIADGDKMGVALSSMTDIEQHQNFTKKLSTFAGAAEKVITEHLGVLVYSGGDDVMAFLPLDQCIQAARSLHTTFGEIMKSAVPEEADIPTLSVGLSIGHSRVPLDILLEQGRSAEKDAKHPDRNGLAIHFQTRGGGDAVKVRAQWDTDLDKELLDWANLFQKRVLSSKTAYDVRKLADSYSGWKQENLKADLLKNDCIRLLKKKNTTDGKIDEQTLLQLTSNIYSLEDLKKLGEKLILAQYFKRTSVQEK